MESLFNSFNFLSWFLLVAGMQYSAGPANILIATSVGKMGFKRSLPMYIGLWVPAIIYCLMFGFGFNTLNKEYGLLFDLLTLIGTFYVFYLGYNFFYASTDPEDSKSEHAVTFKDGFILSTFNGKLIAAVLVMYSVALTESSTDETILLITFLFFLNGCIGNFMWAVGGKLFAKLMGSKQLKWQNYTYGILLVGVAIWMLYILGEKYV